MPLAADPIQEKAEYIDTSGSTKSLSFDVAVTAHSTLAVYVFAWKFGTNLAPTSGMVTDGTNTYTLIDWQGFGNPAVGLWYCFDVAAGSYTITFDPAGGTGWFIGMAIYELKPKSGNGDPFVTGQFSGASPAVDNPQPGSVTPDGTPMIALVGITAANTGYTALTQPTGYTASLLVTAKNQDGGFAWKALSDTTAENPEWTATRNGGAGNSDNNIFILYTEAAVPPTNPDILFLRR